MGDDFFQILPHFTLGRRIPQEIGGMIRRQKRHAAKIEPLSPQSRDGLFRSEQGLEGDGAEANNHFRPNYVELAKEKGRAGLNFVGLGRAIFWWAAFHHIADVNVVAAQAHGLDHLRKKFSRAADERQTLDIFIATRALTNENKLRARVARAEDNVGAFLAQLAALAVADVGANAFERIVLDAFADLE